MIVEGLSLSRSSIVCLTFITAALLLVFSLIWRWHNKFIFSIGTFIYLLAVSFSASSVLWFMTLPSIHYAIYQNWPKWCAPIQIADIVAGDGSRIARIVSIDFELITIIAVQPPFLGAKPHKAHTILHHRIDNALR